MDEVLIVDGQLNRAWASFWLPAPGLVTLDLDAADDVTWQVQFVATTPPAKAATGMAAQGARMESPPVVRLEAGRYEISLSYRDSWFSDGSAGLAAYVSGEHFDSFWLVTDEEDASADYSGAFLELTEPGNVWVTIAAAGAGSTWTVRFEQEAFSATPVVTGTLAAGSTVTAETGRWSAGTTFSYQWLANGKTIRGATKSKLKLTDALKGKKISVRVTGKRAGHPTIVEVSASTAKVATAAKPKVTGTAKVGKTLKAATGRWTKGTTFSYQWLANGEKISGATKSSLKLTKSLKGKKISVQVTGKKSGYATVSKTTSATKKVAA